MWIFCCSTRNDLCAALMRNGTRYPRYKTPEEAVRKAPEGSGVLLLADRYPDGRTIVAPHLWELARKKRLRLYVEYADAAPGVVGGPVKGTEWERIVVASDAFGPSLSGGAILSIPDCRYIPVETTAPWLVAARVAGFDTAVFGLPEDAAPILFPLPGFDALVATARLSAFRTGRYGPASAWAEVWRAILAWLNPSVGVAPITWTSRARPAFGADEPLPAGAERRALRRAASWVSASRLLIATGRFEEVKRLLGSGVEVCPRPDSGAPRGNGSFGVLEGYASGIGHDGSQMQRLPVRADCQAETAMVLALDAETNNVRGSSGTARRLLAFLYGPSGLTGGNRGNPKHPSFGLIGWGAYAPAWEIANYGDDNARALLATMLAAACLGTADFDAAMLRALMANLRTTGRLGFRGDRIDMPDLERRGWSSYAEAETVNVAPHFEAYLWACYLWAWRHTAYRPFLTKAEAGIRRTMGAYPDAWRFNDSSERAQMLLPLAWLNRVAPSEERLGWLRRVASDLIAIQQPCGAIPERFLARDAGYYRIPRSNDEYGVTETPLIQQNGDPASDQLYTTGFALLGLHEAAAATGDSAMREAEGRLAAYLCRIQVRSEDFPYLDGAWFRGFDFRRWDYWSSSADAVWGAWCVEAGWSAAWTAAVLGLRLLGTSLWDRTEGSRIAAQMERVQAQMARNDGGPYAA